MTAKELLIKADAAALAAVEARSMDFLKPGALVRAGARAAVAAVLEDLDAMLHPENHPSYDPDHVYWEQDHASARVYDQRLGREVLVPEAFEWDSETIEWVDQWLTRLRAEVA